MWCGLGIVKVVVMSWATTFVRSKNNTTITTLSVSFPFSLLSSQFPPYVSAFSCSFSILLFNHKMDNSVLHNHSVDHLHHSPTFSSSSSSTSRTRSQRDVRYRFGSLSLLVAKFDFSLYMNYQYLLILFFVFQ